MTADAIFSAVVAGLGTAILIGMVFIVKFIAQGVNKVKEVKSIRDNKLATIDEIVKKINHISVTPLLGKAEFIDFYLDENEESAFYAIPPEYLKRLRPKLEEKVKQLNQTEESYGYNYAQRRFFIGSKLIFTWSNEIKI